MSWQFGRGTYIGATYIVSGPDGAFLHYTAGQRFGGGETGVTINMGANGLEVGYTQRRNDASVLLHLTDGLEGYWWTGRPSIELFFTVNQPPSDQTNYKSVNRSISATAPVLAATDTPHHTSPLDDIVRQLRDIYAFYKGEARTLLARRPAGDGFPDRWVGFDDLTRVNSTFAPLRNRVQQVGKGLETALLRHAEVLETVHLDVSQRYDIVQQTDGTCWLTRDGKQVRAEGTGYVSFNLFRLLHGRSSSGLHAGLTAGRAVSVLGVLPGSDACFWMPGNSGKVVFTGPEGKAHYFVFAIEYNTGVSLTQVKAVKHNGEVIAQVVESPAPQYYLFPAKHRALKLPKV